MIKLLRYLKPFAVWLVAAAALLFIQAICDLNLPNYMSKIVDIGIQQGGVEYASPDAISATGRKFVRSLMTPQQRSLLDQCYERRISPSQMGNLAVSNQTLRNNEALEKKYPAFADEDIYTLKKVDEATREQLNQAFGSAAWTMVDLFKTMAPGDAPQIEGETGGDTAQGIPEFSTADWNQIFELQPMLTALPKEVLAASQKAAAEQDSLMLSQTGTAFAKGYCQQLGLDTAALQSDYILRVGVQMLLIALAGGAATVLVGLLAARISSGAARDIRTDLFRKVETFSNGEFDRFSTSSLITRTTNDITQVQMLFMMGIRMLCYAPIMGIGGVIMALNKSVSMSWIIVLAVILLIGLVMVIFSITMPRFKLVQKLIDRLNLVSRENLNGLPVIRAFGTQDYEKKRFDKTNRDLTENSRFVNRIMTFMMPAMMLIMNGATLLVIWNGAHQIAASTMQVGDMMAYMQYAMQVIMSFLMISMMFIMVPRASVSGDRVQEVLQAVPAIRDPEESKPFDKEQMGVVEFKNVCFQYTGADENVLDDISFVASPGETTAIIGPTGSGKSTLINLIPRFYDVTSGSITVNGVDVRELGQHELHDTIGYVPQKGVLLSGTIDSNLRYGRPGALIDTVEKAAEIAQASSFIAEKEEGYQSPIAQGGSNVSGGQKQRLSIARALVKESPIYIFDDSFSALDFKTDAALRRALHKNTAHSTVLIVAQRVSTIMQAEQILVLEEGRIVGRGTHKELLKSCPEYYEIAASQLTKEELQ